MSVVRAEDRFTKARLAAIRSRMVAALQGDEQALQVLDRVFPETWNDAAFAVVWMLGNAARFADDSWPFDPQAWLDRLVDPNGNPK